MLLPRDSYSSPPPPRTKAEDNPTLLVSWWCTGFALAIILVRLCGRYIRTERLFREDKIMALSLIPLLARMGLVHLVLIWGTNNTTGAGLTQLQLEHRETGSRLILAARIMYALLWVTSIWVYIVSMGADCGAVYGSRNLPSLNSSSVSQVTFGGVHMKWAYKSSVGSSS